MGHPLGLRYSKHGYKICALEIYSWTITLVKNLKRMMVRDGMMRGRGLMMKGRGFMFLLYIY